MGDNGLVASLLLVIYKSSPPPPSPLGRVPGVPGAYSGLKLHPENQPIPGGFIVRLDAPLYSANALTVRDQIKEMIAEAKPTTVILDVAAQGELDFTSAAQIKAEDVEIEQLRRRGRFSFISAIVIILVAIVVVTFVASLNVLNSTLQSFLVGGLSVFSWVAVWEPFNIFLYNWRIPARCRQIFELLQHAEVVIQPQSGQNDLSGVGV